MPKVSIILPTFNRGWIIKRAIDSVLNQTFTDFELIIIDDGSIDDTKEILSSLTSNQIKVIFQEENRGVSAARNEGLKQASGELISYLDSDNLWYANFLEVMTEEITKEDLVLVYSSQNTFLMGGDKTFS